MYVDDFKLSGPAENIAAAWNLIRSPSEIAPKGIDMDPPTPVGRYLGCEHHATEKWITWQGEDPTVLDPPPPKQPKEKKADSAPAGFHDPVEAAVAGRLPMYCDRSYSVPDGQDVWVRYDPNAQHFRTTLQSGSNGTPSGDV